MLEKIRACYGCYFNFMMFCGIIADFFVFIPGALLYFLDISRYFDSLYIFFFPGSWESIIVLLSIVTTVTASALAYLVFPFVFAGVITLASSPIVIAIACADHFFIQPRENRQWPNRSY